MTATEPPVRPAFVYRALEACVPGNRRRAFWRQRLMTAEAGVRLLLRLDSTMFLHLFIAGVAAVTGVMVGLSFVEWLLLAAGLAAVVISELFNLSLQILAHRISESHPQDARQAARLATAGAVVTIAASVAMTAFVLGRRLWELFR